MKFIELNQTIKQEINNLYVIKGEDYFLINQAINTIKSSTIEDFEEFNFVKIDADKLKLDELKAIVSTLPFSNEYRLIVLNNPNNEIVKFINNYQLDDFVVLVVVGADKLTKGTIVDCSKLDKKDIERYILNQIKKSNITITNQALDYLIDATESNMSRINTELNKIISFVGNDNQINFDNITNLVSNTKDYVIFMLTNAIDDKNLTNYQKVLNEMSKSLSFSEIFSYLGKYFRRMQYICLNKDDDTLAKILNIKPYAINISRNNISKNGIKYYLNLYQKYVELDYKIKSGKITPDTAIYELIF